MNDQPVGASRQVLRVIPSRRLEILGLGDLPDVDIGIGVAAIGATRRSMISCRGVGLGTTTPE